MTGLLKSFAAVAIGLAMGFAALETATRTFLDTGMEYDLEMWKYALRAKRVSADDRIGHEHVPGVDTVLMGVPVSINAAGLRDTPIVLPKPADTLRVLMLGDSITFGWGVADKDRVSEILQANLAVDVVNAGVGNYNAAMSVAWYLRDGRNLDADAIVFNYFINDAETQPVRKGGWLAENSAAYVYFGGKLDTALRLFQERQDWRTYYSDLYDPANPGLEAMKNALRRLADAARDDGIPVVFAIYPELRELSPYPFGDVHRTLAGLAESLGWQVVDLLPSVEYEPPGTLWVTVPDPHPNARANALFADVLAPVLRKLVKGP